MYLPLARRCVPPQTAAMRRDALCVPPPGVDTPRAEVPSHVEARSAAAPSGEVFRRRQRQLCRAEVSVRARR